MGRLTEERIQRIVRSYNADPSYTNVAEKEGVDRRTVMKYVASSREETIQDKGAATDRQQIQRRRAGGERGQSVLSQAFRLMKKGVAPVDIAIQLGLNEDEYRGYHRQFLRLTGNHKLDKLYMELGDDENLFAFTNLYSRMKAEGMLDGIQESVTLLKQGTALEKRVAELQESLNEKHISINKKRNELESIENKIANGKNTLKQLEDDVTSLGHKHYDLDYNLRTLEGRLRGTQDKLDLLRHNKIYPKVINRIIEDIIDQIKNKDEFIRLYTLATCIAFRKMDQKQREILIDYSGQDRLMDEAGRTRFFKARDELRERTKQELGAIFLEEGTDEFEDRFEEVISRYRPVEDEDEEEDVEE